MFYFFHIHLWFSFASNLAGPLQSIYFFDSWTTHYEYVKLCQDHEYIQNSKFMHFPPLKPAKVLIIATFKAWNSNPRPNVVFLEPPICTPQALMHEKYNNTNSNQDIAKWGIMYPLLTTSSCDEWTISNFTNSVTPSMVIDNGQSDIKLYMHLLETFCVYC